MRWVGGGVGWVLLWLLSAMKINTSTWGEEQVKRRILQVLGRIKSSLGLAFVFFTDIDDTPPLNIRNHPPYHLHVALVALLNTCTWICIIPRRYPTAKHKKSASFSLAAALVVLLNTCTWIYIIPRLYPTLKSSSFSLADNSGPPQQSIFVRKHH